ncbi:MAG: IclR family transcriptional regulator [Anaerolineae bacterium]
MPKQNPSSPQSVFGKISAILDTFTVEQPTLSLAEITAATAISKTTVFRLLQELADLGYVKQAGKSYRLGLSAFRLGMVAKEQMGLNDLLDDLLRPLAEKTQETVITATLDRDQILYLHVIESLNPLRFVAGAGARRALPFGATGMALLSQLDLEKQKALLAAPFQTFTAKTITDLAGYLARLDKIEQSQLVIERGEYYDGIMAFAVPVQGKRPLTFTVVGPEERILPTQDLIIEELQHAAENFKKLQFEWPI